MTGLFESDEEALARRIKNIENMDKPIKFHQWFIPFFIFILGPIIGCISITVYEYEVKDFAALTQMGEMFGLVLLAFGVYYLLRRLGLISICSW